MLMGAVMLTGLDLEQCRALTLEELTVAAELKTGGRKRARR